MYPQIPLRHKWPIYLFALTRRRKASARQFAVQIREPIAIEFQSLGRVRRWSECQAIIKNAVWLKIRRRSKQNLDSLVLSATILNEVGG